MHEAPGHYNRVCTHGAGHRPVDFRAPDLKGLFTLWIGTGSPQRTNEQGAPRGESLSHCIFAAS